MRTSLAVSSSRGGSGGHDGSLHHPSGHSPFETQRNQVLHEVMGTLLHDNNGSSLSLGHGLASQGRGGGVGGGGGR